MRRFTSLILTTVSATALAMPAYAQDAEATAEAVAESAPLEGETAAPTDEVTNAQGQPSTAGEIVVTGSRIRRNNFNTPAPVNIYNREDTVLAGATGIADTLQSSAVTSGTSQISDAFLGFISEGGAAANTVGLRGLGAQRTLVLLNGRRLAPAGVGSQLVAADLNVLPTAVVQRIEVLREGASATYGSDAIAGVINVITDNKLNGVTLDAYGDFPTELSGSAGRTYRASITAGKTFDRGHILASFEFKKSNGVRFRDNPDWRCPTTGYYQTIGGVRQEVGQIDPATGEVACFGFGPNGAAGSGIASGYGIYGIYFGGAYNNIYSIGRVGYANNDINQPQVVNSFLLRPIKTDSQLASHVISPIKTYTGYLNGAYELDALGNAELYGEVLFTRRESAQEGATQFSINAGQLDPLIEVYGGTYYATGQPIGNYEIKNLPGVFYQESPFFPVALANGVNCCFGVGANRFTPFILPDQLQESSQEINFMRANGGLRGDVGVSDWRYDANFQYSRTRAKQTLRNPTVDRVNNVLMTDLAPAGMPSQYTVTALPGQVGAGNTYTCSSNLTGGVYNGGTCVPFNIYDPAILVGGDIPQGVYDYLYVPLVDRTSFDQYTLSVAFDGTLATLPAGDLKAAFGFEYRRDEIDNRPSADGQASNIYNRTNEGRTKGSDSVKEVFAELNIPLVKDKPMFHMMELDLSGRYTNYKSYGGGFVYRANFQWAPVEPLRFRGSIGTNFRAPNLYEQFVNNQQGFFGGGNDPCDSFATLDPNSNTYINCLAQLTPILGSQAAALAFFNASSITVNTTGGKATLEAEKAKSWGLGAVFTMPRHIANFSASVDYFHTEVKGEVNTLGLGILNRCYDEDPAVFAVGGGIYCPLIGPRLPLGTVYPGTLSSFQNPYINLSSQVAAGFDFNARYETRLLGGKLSIQGQATKMTEQSLEVQPGQGSFDYNGTPGYPGFGSGPKWTASLDTRFTLGAFTIRHGLDYIGRSSAEKLRTLGLYPSNGGNGVAGQPYEEDLVAEAYYEHSISVQYKIKKLGQITLGVNNVFNEKPPTFSDSQSPAGQYFRIGNYFGGGAYNYKGRSVFVNVTAGF